MTSLLAAYTLWWRELQRFLRQPSRVASAAAMPLLFWLLIGTGLSSSFQMPGAQSDIDFFEYFFPGTVVLLVLFAAIFATISVIDDRHEGFLQGVLVAPVSRSAVVAGKVLGGATLAWLQGLLFVLLAPLAGIQLTPGRILATAAVLALLSVTLTAFGFALAWKIDSSQGYHAIMNVLLLPMWLMSGAFFPIAGAPGWLEWVMRLNPLTYGMAAMRRVLYEDSASLGESLPGLALSLGVLLVWAALAIVVDVWIVRRSNAV